MIHLSYLVSRGSLVFKMKNQLKIEFFQQKGFPEGNLFFIFSLRIVYSIVKKDFFTSLDNKHR